MRVAIEGVDLPGRSCPDPDGGIYGNIHVGLRQKADTVELVPADSDTVRWEFDVRVRPIDGGLDITGPNVAGSRGERFVGLRWGTLAADGTFTVFRALKLRYEDVPPDLVRAAHEGAGVLTARLGLTDSCGWPICASVRPPLVEWSVK